MSLSARMDFHVQRKSLEGCEFRRDALIEKCALNSLWHRPLFLGLPVRNRAAATDSPWPLSTSFKDTVSGKETRNRGFEKHWRLRRVAGLQNRSGPRSLRLHPTTQMNVRSLVMALSPLEPSVDNNRQ